MPPNASLHSHDQHTHRLLSAIESGANVSQRSLARKLGIAVGLTNLIIRRVVRRGWVRMVHVRPNRVSYLLTPAGIAEKARMSRDSLQYSVRFYSEVRRRVGARFATLSREWPGPTAGAEKRIVFFGTGEVAEIGYVCLQETDLTLIGAIDDQGRSRFFDVPLRSPEWLRDTAGTAFEHVVVMAFEGVDGIAEQLSELGIPADRIYCL